MNKVNTKPVSTILNRARRPASRPPRFRLQVKMKPAELWVVSIEKLAAQKAPRSRTLRLAPQRIEISLMRSVAQSALRGTASQWGR